MSDAFSHYENTALAYLESVEATPQTDRLANMLLEAAGHARQQAAVSNVMNGELQHLRGQYEAAMNNARQHETNTRVQRAEVIRANRRIRTLEVRVVKATAGRDRAVENLRPSHNALKALVGYAQNPLLSDSKFGSYVRQTLDVTL